MNNDEELKNLQKRFRLLGYLMFPFTILFALGASAYFAGDAYLSCLLYTSPSPRDRQKSRMPSSA